MQPIKLIASLPQHVYQAKQLLDNEGVVAQRLGINTLTLMENAGLAVFDHIRSCYPGTTKFVVICGKGNNGGDGFVVARLAKKAGVNVEVILCADDTNLKGDAALMFEKMKTQGVSFYCCDDVELHTTNAATQLRHCLIQKDETLTASKVVIVDCLFGIGFKGELSAPLQALVNEVNKSGLQVVSIDVPSGLCADTGQVANQAIIAQSTVSMIAIKKGLVTGQAASYVGQLYLAKLAVGDQFNREISSHIFMQGENALPALPKRAASSHKGNIGSILAIGGNQGMPGAIRLAAEAGLRSGAALMAVCCHQHCQSLIFNGRPEIMLAPSDANSLKESPILQRATALLLGPGLGQDPWSLALFHLVMEHLSNTASDAQQKPQGIIVDADGLRLLSQYPMHYQHWVLTPHVSEAAQLLACTVADIEKDRYQAVQNIVEKYGGVCVLKGAGTLICDGGSVWVNTSGNAGMASGGMGDVLSGIIAALWLQCPSAISAVRLGVYFHGRAADYVAQNQGQRGMLASDLFPYIQQLVNE